MEIVGVARLLRRHWLLLLPGVVLAVLAAVMFLYRVSPSSPHLVSRRQATGLAAARLLLAARHEPAFDPGSRIAPTLPGRASLVADLVATDAARAGIARRAGIRTDELAVFGPASNSVAVSVPIATEATTAANLAHEAYVATIVVDPQLPIISVRVAGPDPRSAAKVAEAVRGGMKRVVAERSTARRLVAARRLGPVTARTVVDGPRKPVAVIVALVVLVAWSVAVVVLVGIARRLRAVRTRRPLGERAAA